MIFTFFHSSHSWLIESYLGYNFNTLSDVSSRSYIFNYLSHSGSLSNARRFSAAVLPKRRGHGHGTRRYIVEIIREERYRLGYPSNGKKGSQDLGLFLLHHLLLCHVYSVCEFQYILLLDFFNCTIHVCRTTSKWRTVSASLPWTPLDYHFWSSNSNFGQKMAAVGANSVFLTNQNSCKGPKTLFIGRKVLFNFLFKI